ncbi:uncharacterized protein LOC122086932 [Macadamia integrifolia]|uniref:uncharacterized protein LOC122086932 n=1 Tax=Macadamia integrifolia TaxID=60698 RepID=UPI001C4F6564|nr:uncharacterized protein LOC122086932 [Macadamia integrifolia]XP_042511783.1 uncharacterized protein LOC122086932 [Macadamia integrifolia]
MDLSVSCGVSDLECGSIHLLKQSGVNHKRSVSTDGDDSVADLGDALTEILHIQDGHESLLGQLESLNRGETCHPEAKMCRDWIIELADSVTGSIQKGLTKSATFPCSKMDTSVDEKTEMPGIGSNGQSSSDSRPACTRSISLPTPSKLLSAMKGSREKQGASLRKLTVKWAPDVYDPPSTTLSHTVKSHNQQRSRTNKKNSKHKHKGKSSRGCTSEKKQYRRTVSNSDLRSKSMASRDRLLFGGFDQSTVGLLGGFDKSTMECVEFVTGQDSNCGSSFLRASLAKVHMPVAEAT